LPDEWVIENNGRFSENAHLYPGKIPKYFRGFPNKISTLGIHTYVIKTENYTQ
jgi:hypothetical protein